MTSAALPHLYIFLDEGGNFDFSPNGTRYFTISAVAAVRPFAWDQSLASFRYDLLESGYDLERFHAAEDRQIVRDGVFGIICQCLSSIRIDSVIVEKRKTGPSFQVPEQFYPRMIGYLLKWILESRNLPEYKEVVVITDTIPVRKKQQTIEKSVKLTLSRMLPSDVSYKVLHHSSMSCFGLQVVDYCNWAIFRRWERGDVRSHRLIGGAIKSEFDIFRTGTTFYY